MHRIATGEPERIGRYELIGRLASGGMGIVYLGCLRGEAGFRRLVAVKRMHAHLLDDPKAVDMLLDEGRIAARLHHPNVVPVLEVGRDSGQVFIVMEYVEAATVEQLVRDAPVPE